MLQQVSDTVRRNARIIGAPKVIPTINRPKPTAHANTRPPTVQSIMALPAAQAGVYDLTADEIRKTRQQIYILNKNNAAGWKWRTMVSRSGGRLDTLLIWRIQ